MRAIVIGVWLLVLFAVGIAINPTSIPSWAILAGLGFLPPFFVLRLWKHPPPSMSEDIQKALR